ncbi:MAG: PAS domain S-box protein [Myxococcales bacterium]|nr:PAS domain S-box protein [Myxococcales bacterium]
MSARVFVVEDEALIAMELVDRLQELGYVVCGRALRGDQALERIPAAEPDLILMDINLGAGPSGIEVAERLRASSDVPVLFLTAYSDAELAERAAQTGSFGFLVKPFQPHALRANIEMALALRVADRTVRESEARFRHVIENMSDGVVIDDLAGRIVYCNDRFLEIFGLTRANADLCLEDYVAPGFRQLLRERHDRRVRGEPVPTDFEYEGQRSDGSRVWVSVAVTLVRGANDRVVGTQSVLRDVTDRKLVEVSLELLSTKLGRLRGDDFVAAVAREVAHMLGVDGALVTERLPGTPARLRTVAAFARGERLPPIEFPVAGSPCESTLAEGFFKVEGRVSERFPTTAWLQPLTESYAGIRLEDSRGGTIGTIAVFDRRPLRHLEHIESVLRLFAVRTAAEIERVAIEAKLSDLFEFSPDGQLMVDGDGVIVLANERAHEMFGYDRGGLVGRSVDALVREEARRQHHRLRESFVHGGRPRLMGARGQPFLARRRDDSFFPADISLGSVRVPDGVLVLAAIRDVSARVKAEEAHRALEARLRQSQRLEAMGTLAGGIAHDFNNILTAIFANVDHALGELPSSHPTAPSLRDVAAAASRASGLVRQILAFSRQESSERTRLSPADIVDEVARLLRASMPSQVSLITERLGNVSVMADATQLHQVLMNLGTNAWHALAGRPGAVRLSVERLVVGDGGHEAALPGVYACIRVKDDGVGMTPAVLERIFDPFFTTKPVGQGTGLGLAVVHGIVRDHGGSITVESEPGQGTVFSILLPAATMAGSERPAVAQPASSRGGPRGHVLYLDDDPLIVTAATRLVRSLGYSVTGFVRADEAIAAIESEPRRFDLVVTDLQMPTLSGLEVASRVAAIRTTLPVVLVSGDGGWSEAELAARGIHGHLDKPYGLPELERALGQALARAGAQPQSSSSPM